MKRPIRIAVEAGDILRTGADVVALKFSGELVGAARAVAAALGKTAADMPSTGKTAVFAGDGAIGAGQALFVGVVELASFDHAEVRQLGHDIVKALPPGTRHLATTVQGTGLGLSPGRALRSELQGCADAIGAGLHPVDLERITFVERDPESAKRLGAALAKILPSGVIHARVTARAPVPAAAPTPAPQTAPVSTPATSPGFDVFISYKSEDAEPAGRVYEVLRAAGLRVFFSKESLPRLGSDEYHEQIDLAIERARHLIVVTSSAANATSRWVKYEWRLFLGEKLAGRKDGNLLTVLAGSMRLQDLPIGLRHREVVGEHELERLLEYVSPGEPPAAGAGSEVVALGDLSVLGNELLKDITWTAADDRARSLSAGGAPGWRLPSLAQLARIREAGLFPDRYCYWSCEAAPGGEMAYVHFDDGHVGQGPKELSSGLCAVFVREAGSG